MRIVKRANLRVRRQRLAEGPLEPARSAAGEPSAADATTGRSVLRGGVWNVGGQLLLQFYSIATSVVAARFLGVAGVGQLVYIAFVQTTVVLALTAGLPQALMRYISAALGQGDPVEVRALQRWAWRVEAVGAAIGGTSLTVIGFLGATPRAAWLFAGVGAGAAIMHHVPSAVLIAAQRWRAYVSISIVTGSAAMAAKIAVLAAGGGIPGMFAVDAAQTCVSLGVGTYLARRTIRELAPPTRRASRSIMPVVRFAAVSSMTIFLTFVVWRRTELFFLKRYSSDVDVAIYSIPFSVVAALLLVPTGLAQVVGPAFATLFGAGATARLQSGYGRALRVSMTFTLPVTALALVSGPTLLKLVYGNGFAGTGAVLRILLATFPVIPLMDMSNGLLIGLGKRWPQVIIGAFAAGVSVVLDFVLIPAHGAIGAAAANACAQLLGAIPIVIYANRTIGPEWHLFEIFRSAVAAAASGGAALLVLSFLPDVPGVILGTLTGSACFVLLAVALKILPSDDAAWLEQTIGGALGGAVGKVVRYATATQRA